MIEAKNINKIIIGFVVIAVLFTSIFTVNPGLLGIKAAAADPAYAAKLFPEDGIVTIDIKADPEKWSEMLENATAEEYIPCDITINGETFYSVGIRPKGNSSLSMVARDENTDRFSFKIKMDKYVEGQNYYGLSKFVLNNMQGDATYMKEYLSYDMFKTLGVNTPLYAYADISLNGEPWGFYLAIESVEEDFAQRTYGADYGMLYKPESQDMGGGQKPAGQKANAAGAQKTDGKEDKAHVSQNTDAQRSNNNQPPGGMPGGPAGGGDGMPGGFAHGNNDGASGGAIDRNNRLPDMPDRGGNKMNGGFGGGMNGGSGGASLVYTDDDPNSYGQIFDNAVFKADDADKKKIIAALKALSTGQKLKDYVDTDEVLRYFAVNTAMVNLDSYICSFQHNYYLYEKDGKISILPWDLNLSFAGFQSRSAENAVNFPIDTPVSGVELSQRPLIGSLIAKQEYKEVYHDYLQKVVDEYFNSGHFDETISKLDSLIGEHVKNDASAFYTYDQYKAAVQTLKQYGALRAKSIQGQLDGTVPSTSEAQTTNPDQLIDASGITMSTMGSQGNGGGVDKGSAFRNRQQQPAKEAPQQP